MGYTVGYDGHCSICDDNFQMVNGKCVPIPPTMMSVEDECAFPMKKTKFADETRSCDRCPLNAPYARYDATQEDLTTCVSRSECEYPDVLYFAELEESFPICLTKPIRFDFKSNGVNVTIISRAVSVLGGKRYVAEVSD